MIVHSSFMVSCRCPSDSLGSVADRILRELEDEDEAAETTEPSSSGGRPNQSRRNSGEAEESELSRQVVDGGVEHPAEPEPQVASRPEPDAREVAVEEENGAAGPRIAPRGSRADRGPTRPQPAARSTQRKRKEREEALAKDAEATKRRRRREADAAREARAARRQTPHSEEEAATATTAQVGADEADRLPERGNTEEGDVSGEQRGHQGEDVKAEMHMAARTKTNAAVAQATRAAL
jgi:hypothetical protein